MMGRLSTYVILLALVVSSLIRGSDCQNGKWHVVTTAGVSAMHMTLNRFNKVIIFDRTDYGPSQMKLPNGRCRYDNNDMALKVDCYAHSYEYDIATNTARPLEVLTDTWCSSGAFLSNGTLLSTGGFNDGAAAVRYYGGCSDGTCDWAEAGSIMSAARWYASNQILPDNRVIVVGGRRSFSYEFVPKSSPKETATQFPFLIQTNTAGVENNLYPFLHLSSDGNLFIFANRKSILLDYKTNTVVKTFPDLPGGARNYPSSGSSVMLPLQHADGFQRVEVLVCGGAPDGAFVSAGKGQYVNALADCARMVITDPNPTWAVESMPSGRVMHDMLILPTGDVIIINGAQQGTAGWGDARQPAYAPWLYSAWKPLGRRFETLRSSTIPRVYHSTANVLPDGRILVGGSNTNVGYVFTGVPFPTELRLETYTPYYLSSGYDYRRPTITAVSSSSIAYAAQFKVTFSLPATGPAAKNLFFNVYYPPFTTHAYSMNQRMLFLAYSAVSNGSNNYTATLTAPPSAVAAPPGYYMLRVINDGIPSSASWVHLG